MKKYVLGFMFDQKMKKVVLMKKNRPPWQDGRYNGVGGKMKDRESPHTAMRREFDEEAGLDLEWFYYGKLYGEDFEIYLFRTKSDKKARQMEDEKIYVFPIRELPKLCVPNVHWMVPMALSFSCGETAKSFKVEEIK